MAQYRKRPVIVDAIQWTGENQDDVQAFMLDHCPSAPSKGFAPYTNPGGRAWLWIEKSNTTGTIEAGTWIIAERDGEGFYPCLADEFDQTYALVAA